MKYYKGDIIEVLNLCQYDDQQYTVGFKYRVKSGTYGGDQINVYNERVRIDHTYIKHNQIMLYHRPLRNWFNYIVNKII